MDTCEAITMLNYLETRIIAKFLLSRRMCAASIRSSADNSFCLRASAAILKGRNRSRQDLTAAIFALVLHHVPVGNFARAKIRLRNGPAKPFEKVF